MSGVVVNETASREPLSELTRMDETQVDTGSEAVDTRTARVGGIASRYERDAHLRPYEVDRLWDQLAAATLRALAAERDAAIARAEVERDALVAAMREFTETEAFTPSSIFAARDKMRDALKLAFDKPKL